MKKLFILLFIPTMLIGQRLTTDSIYYKPTNTSAGRWISSKTLIGTDNTKLPIADTIKRDKLATRKMVDSIVNLKTTGKVTYVGAYNASGNSWPATGVGGGNINIGDWWTISVSGTLGGITVTTDNQIYALVNNPGQTASNWDVVGSTTTIPVAKLAGEGGNGYTKYTSRTKTKGAFYGGNVSTNWPTSTDSTLNLDANFTASSVNIGLVSGAAITGNKLYVNSTENTDLVRINNTGSGTSQVGLTLYNSNGIGQQILLNGGSTAKYILGKLNNVENWYINYNGYGSFNGGLSSSLGINVTGGTNNYFTNNVDALILHSTPSVGNKGKYSSLYIRSSTSNGIKISCAEASTNNSDSAFIVSRKNIMQAYIDTMGRATLKGGLKVDSAVYFTKLPSAGSGTTLVLDAQNRVIPLSSSKNFKYDISKFKIKSEKIFDLVPYQYKYKGSNTEEFGYMAEDVFKVLPELVNLDKDGKPYSLKDYRIVVLLVEEVKKQRKQISDLEKRISKLEKK